MVSGCEVSLGFFDSGHSVTVGKDVERLDQRFMLFTPHDHSVWTGSKPFSLCPVQRGQIPNIKSLYPNRKGVYTPYSRSPRWNVLLPASAVIKGQRLLPQPSRSRRWTHPVQPIPHLLEFQWRCQAGERAPGLCCSQLANPALHLGAQ